MSSISLNINYQSIPISSNFNFNVFKDHLKPSPYELLSVKYFLFFLLILKFVKCVKILKSFFVNSYGSVANLARPSS